MSVAVELRETKHIAMWSGPRNISTAMMYSFDSRSDTYCSDEPLYAHYLAATGIQHPGASEIIENDETDWQAVVQNLGKNPADGSKIWYQKHMCHHITEGMGLDWINSMTTCFLIRDPREVLLSLAKKTDVIDAWATGLPQQTRLVERVKESGVNPLIVDSRDILQDPNVMLPKLCHALHIPYDSAMLSWQSGPKQCDGIWAEHWYDAVWESTEFAEYRAREGELSSAHQAIYDEVRPIYDELYNLRLV